MSARRTKHAPQNGQTAIITKRVPDTLWHNAHTVGAAVQLPDTADVEFSKEELEAIAQRVVRNMNKPILESLVTHMLDHSVAQSYVQSVADEIREQVDTELRNMMDARIVEMQDDLFIAVETRVDAQISEDMGSMGANMEKVQGDLEKLSERVEKHKRESLPFFVDLKRVEGIANVVDSLTEGYEQMLRMDQRYSTELRRLTAEIERLESRIKTLEQ